jgi:hypothetical protein
MTLLLVVPVAWILLLTLVAGLCMAARRGEQSPAIARVAPSVRAQPGGTPARIVSGQRLEPSRRRITEPASAFAQADGVAA